MDLTRYCLIRGRCWFDLERGTARVSENAVEVRGDIVWGAPKTARRPPHRAASRARLSRNCQRTSTPTSTTIRARSSSEAPRGGVLRAGLWRSRFWTPATRRAGVDGRTHSRSSPHRGRVVDRRRRQRQADRDMGRAHERVGRARPLRAPLRRTRRARAVSSRCVRRVRFVPPDDDESRGVPRGFRGVKPKLAIVAGEKSASDQGEDGGRTPTRTADLCRVKAAL